MSTNTRCDLWWGESGLIQNFNLDDFLYQLAIRNYHPDTRWIDGKLTEAILNRMGKEPSGIVLIGTTPAFTTDYGDRVPARGYQIMWRQAEAREHVGEKQPV